MKKQIFLLAVLLTMSFMANAQLLKDRTNGKMTVGFDLFTDVNQGKGGYENFNLRTINQGFNAYITYNMPMGESKHTVSFGVGVSCHNYYIKSAYLADPYTTPMAFTHGYTKKSKLNFNYFDIPMELNFRIANKFKISFGGKIGFLLSSKTKIKGKIFPVEEDSEEIEHMWEVQYRNLSGTESVIYSAFARIGYRCINLYIGYQFTSSFKKDKGPELMPLSIGIGIRAY